jgi:hypothetical protein
VNSKEIKQHIVNEISLMPQYHIDIFGEKDYKTMLTGSNWIRLGKKKLDNGDYIRIYEYAPKFANTDLGIYAAVHSDNERVFDVQYTAENSAENFSKRTSNIF